MSRVLLTVCFCVFLLYALVLGATRRAKVKIAIPGISGGRCMTCVQGRSVLLPKNTSDPCDVPCQSSTLLEVSVCAYSERTENCTSRESGCHYLDETKHADKHVTCSGIADFSDMPLTADDQLEPQFNPWLRVSYRGGEYSFTCTNGQHNLHTIQSGSNLSRPWCNFTQDPYGTQASRSMGYEVGTGILGILAGVILSALVCKIRHIYKSQQETGLSPPRAKGRSTTAQAPGSALYDDAVPESQEYEEIGTQFSTMTGPATAAGGPAQYLEIIG